MAADETQQTLETFKIGDLTQTGSVPNLAPNTRASEEQGEQEEVSTGFGRIESLLDDYSEADIRKRLHALDSSLEDFSSSEVPKPQQAQDINKAQKALRHAHEMLEYLLEVRNKMTSEHTEKS